MALSERAKGPNKTGGIKGEKSDWVNAQVYPKFVARFKSDGPGGPNLESLKEVSSAFSTLYSINGSIENGAVVSEQCSSE